MAQLTDGYFSLADNTNKIEGETTPEGLLGEAYDELDLSISDEELVLLANQWKKNWDGSKAKTDFLKKADQNERFWLGHQDKDWDYEHNQDVPEMDNIIFEALETFLPQATKSNPEPTVYSDPDSELLATNVRQMLITLTDSLKIKLKVKQAVRYWSLYQLGVMKVGFSMKENEISVHAVRPQKLILEPEASIDVAHYTGYYIGESRIARASDLIQRFKGKEDVINKNASDKTASLIEYIEWWTDDYVFWTLNNELLGKAKNPHWNYSQKQTVINEMGMPVTQDIPPYNHFIHPKKPYAFLSVFNLGKKPVDETSLISQSISSQLMINKRIKQITTNAESANNSLAVSGDFFTKDQAKQAADAKRSGQAIWVPTGDVNKAIANLPAQPLPSFIYEQLVDTRNEMRGVFGITGLTSQGIKGEETVRGKIIVKEQDASRIGGGVVEYIEQFYDEIYNWLVQLMAVYYQEPKIVSILGQQQAVEVLQLQASDFTAKLVVTVKEGSLIPKDPLVKYNRDIDLYQMGALSLIDLLKSAEIPNAEQVAESALLWNFVKQGLLPPQILFPNFPMAPMPVQGMEQGGNPQGTNPASNPADTASAQSAPQLSSVPIQ